MCDLTILFLSDIKFQSAFGYGFDELGEYLISKGADDSLQNAHGLTCYEGLDMDEL